MPTLSGRASNSPSLSLGPRCQAIPSAFRRRGRRAASSRPKNRKNRAKNASATGEMRPDILPGPDLISCSTHCLTRRFVLRERTVPIFQAGKSRADGMRVTVLPFKKCLVLIYAQVQNVELVAYLAPCLNEFLE